MFSFDGDFSDVDFEEVLNLTDFIIPKDFLMDFIIGIE